MAMKAMSARVVDVGSCRLRVASAGEATAPLVLLLHGWPEFWYSWRHQLLALAKAGYHAVAPDLRGFGGSDAPEHVKDFDCLEIAKDMLGLLKVLGKPCYALVGHDWGGQLVWYLGCLHPQAFPRLCVMSTPPVGLLVAPIDQLSKQFGDNFNYVLYHNEFQSYGTPWPTEDPTARRGPAEDEYEADVESFLLAVYLAGAASTAEVKAMELPKPRCQDPKRSAGGFRDRMRAADASKHLPSWMPRHALDRFVHAFRTSGFRGGLNYYRCMDRNFEITQSAFRSAGGKIHQPLLFIAGEKDSVIKSYGGPKANKLLLEKVCADLRGCTFIPDCGHWNPQEKPGETSAALIDFLEATKHVATPGHSRL
ncbi:unnamed protein product [Effrenium voratum]|uniref:AB hydrolase-1 domain-containing protein n=1 Tax=Effrenium voratum TaxID=2562239 RepID=A0AA36IFQ2_9DINO|nr:unnamed protein product [Effrenium voratum]CAJ1425235.1 unnamed protein product [Effrenium voratum]